MVYLPIINYIATLEIGKPCRENQSNLQSDIPHYFVETNSFRHYYTIIIRIIHRQWESVCVLLLIQY